MRVAMSQVETLEPQRPHDGWLYTYLHAMPGVQSSDNGSELCFALAFLWHAGQENGDRLSVCEARLISTSCAHLEC